MQTHRIEFLSLKTKPFIFFDLLERDLEFDIWPKFVAQLSISLFDLLQSHTDAEKNEHFVGTLKQLL